MNVLIADPSKSIRAIIESVLSPYSPQISSAKSIKETQAALEATDRFDLMIIGSVLEDGGAGTLVPILRAHTGSQTAPIFLLTSNDDASILTSIQGAGVTEVFAKANLRAFSNTLINRIESAHQAKREAGRVLYVEDSEAEAYVVSMILKDHHYQIVQCSSAEEAYETLTNDEFDIVLSDVFVAGKMTGLGLVREIRDKMPEKNLPFLAMSSSDDNARKVELLRAGANDFVAKPVLEEELVARIHNLVANKRLIDEVQQQRERLETLAMTDQLTDLHNRNYLFSEAPKKLAEAMRHRWDCAVLVVDVDHFKKINDNYGHDIGDCVLRDVAACLKNSFRVEDIVARFGGEEFVVVMPHCDYKQGLEKAEQVRALLETLKPQGLTVTASFGVSTMLASQIDRVSFDELFKLADTAVYRSKKNGRNRVTGYLSCVTENANSTSQAG